MERGEPTFVPEWYKGSGSSASVCSSSNHLGRSSSEELGIRLPPRNRLSVSACNHDAPLSPFSMDRSSSSFPQNASSNGSMSHEKDTSIHSTPYSSFGRSHRGRDRKKDLDLYDRDRSISLDNGFCDTFKSSKNEKNTSTPSHSMVSGQRVELWARKQGNDLKNSAHSGGNIISSISKASFDRNFPSLGAEDKQGHSDPSRVSSPGLSHVIQSLPIGASTVIGGNGWTSALVDVSVMVGGNRPVPSSALPAASVSLASTASSMNMGLNMAETLARAPLRVQNTPQLSVDTQRIEELTRIQYTKLIPLRPSMSKSSILNSDNSKSRAAKGADINTPPKIGQELSSQLVVNQALHTPARFDIQKTSQAGNFQVLNRERNEILRTAKDGPNLTSASGVVTPVSGVPSLVAPFKSPIISKVKADIKGGSLGSTHISFGGKRPLSQAQNRNDFFNSLRKKTSANQPASTDPSCIVSSSTDQMMSNCASGSGLDFPVVTGNDATRVYDACQEPDKFIPDSIDDEEEAFLRSLGWEENSGEEALTAEEIDAFVKEYEKQKPSSRLSQREIRLLN